MRPIEDKEVGQNRKYQPGKMSDFGILFYSELNNFLKNHESFFISLKDIIEDIERDFEKFEKDPVHFLNILKKYTCGISDDCSEYDAPFELPSDLYIEDWNCINFGYRNFLDFLYHPWLTESLGCFGRE